MSHRHRFQTPHVAARMAIAMLWICGIVPLTLYMLSFELTRLGVETAAWLIAGIAAVATAFTRWAIGTLAHRRYTAAASHGERCTVVAVADTQEPAVAVSEVDAAASHDIVVGVVQPFAAVTDSGKLLIIDPRSTDLDVRMEHSSAPAEIAVGDSFRIVFDSISRTGVPSWLPKSSRPSLHLAGTTQLFI